MFSKKSGRYVRRQGFLNYWLNMTTTCKGQNVTKMKSYMHTKEKKAT